MGGEEDIEEGMCLVIKSQASKRGGGKQMRNSEKTRNTRVEEALFKGSYKTMHSTHAANCLLDLCVPSGNETAASSALRLVFQRLEHGPDGPIVHEE